MPEIGLTQLSLALLPCLGVIWIGWLWSGSARELVIATLRMVVQLMAIGFVLVFIFAAEHPLIGLGVVAVMVTVSALIATRVVKQGRGAALGRALIAQGLAGGLVLSFVLIVVLRLAHPLVHLRVMIPIAGMIFSNGMTAVTLAAERLQSGLDEGHTFSDARKVAWSAALIPQVNALMAVGLVSLPGMMTGQILSGVDPLIAVRYQIVVMTMVLSSAGFSVALYLWLSGRALGGRALSGRGP